MNFWTSKYGAHEGCHLWLPYQKELKMKSLIAWDIQQVDKSVFSRIGQHFTTTYIRMKQLATEYRTALFLQLCVQWTPKSTGMLTLSVFFKYGFLGYDLCQCRWIQVSQRNMPTPSLGSKWKGKMWSRYGHVTLEVLTEIHRWTLKFGAAWFSETTIKY